MKTVMINNKKYELLNDYKDAFNQEDVDARWTVKGNINHYGYKDHIKVDATSKLILNYEVTSANVHDSQKLNDLLDDNDKIIYADSAYVGIELKNKTAVMSSTNKPLILLLITILLFPQ